MESSWLCNNKPSSKQFPVKWQNEIRICLNSHMHLSKQFSHGDLMLPNNVWFESWICYFPWQNSKTETHTEREKKSFCVYNVHWTLCLHNFSHRFSNGYSIGKWQILCASAINVASHSIPAKENSIFHFLWKRNWRRAAKEQWRWAKKPTKNKGMNICFNALAT